MKKNLLWTLAAAFALASCSDTELVEAPPQVQEQDAIAFSTYVGDNAQSRATVVTTETLEQEGFGVNAWYTKGKKFTEDGVVKEAFMTNTKVTYNEDKNAWTYSPLKYWPNNAGHMVSFFAYGPYSVKDMVTDTDIEFIVVPNVKKQVDLIYHNQATNSTIDMKKPAVDTRVEFKFDHALSRIDLSVEAASDVVIVDPNNSKLDGNTVINVKKVVLMEAGDETAPADPADPKGPFYKSGTLSLVDGTWSNKSAELQGFTFTGEHFYRTVKADDIATPETAEIDVVQLHKFNNKQDLLNDESYLMIIPNDENLKTTFNIYIEYDVITETPEGDDISKITNCITSKKPLEVEFKQGMAYNFNLVLGMTSVKFEASVAEWDETTPSQDEWLPENIPFTTTQKDDKTWFLIQSASELATFRDFINHGEVYIDENGVEQAYHSANYLQTADIVLPDSRWEPIGISGNDGPIAYEFQGTYDGNGHTVSNVIINNEGNSGYMSGLFYKVISATIKNVNVEGEISDNWGLHAGGVVGLASGTSTIENCHFSGSIHLGIADGANRTGYVAGVVGEIERGSVKACSSNAEITVGVRRSEEYYKFVYIGGVVGDAGSASVIGCYNTGNINVSVNSIQVGGIVGNTSAAVTSCYNTGTITIATNATGNTVGSIIASGSGTPSYCYYTTTNAAVNGKEDSSFISVKSVSSDELLSSVVPWLNYGLNGNGTTSGYEYYVESNSLKIRVGKNAGEAPAEEPTEDESGSDDTPDTNE